MHFQADSNRATHFEIKAVEDQRYLVVVAIAINVVDFEGDLEAKENFQKDLKAEKVLFIYFDKQVATTVTVVIVNATITIIVTTAIVIVITIVAVVIVLATTVMVAITTVAVVIVNVIAITAAVGVLITAGVVINATAII